MLHNYIAGGNISEINGTWNLIEQKILTAMIKCISYNIDLCYSVNLINNRFDVTVQKQIT